MTVHEVCGAALEIGQARGKVASDQGPCETVETRLDALELNLIVYLNLLKLGIWFNLKLGKLGVYFQNA
jgi:hypothetical protein